MIIQAPQQVAQQEVDDWWMGQVVFCEGSTRDPRVNRMFQVSKSMTGESTGSMEMRSLRY